MRRWIIIIPMAIAVIVLTFSAIFQIIFSLLPSQTQESILGQFGVYIIGILATSGILSVLINLMQWFGISPINWLPKTPLQRENPVRYKLAQTKNVQDLKHEIKKAKDSKEYDWMHLFAKAWTNLEPNEPKAYENLCRALKELNRPEELKQTAEKLIELQKLEYEGYAYMGLAFTRMGDNEEAKKWYEEALKFVSRDFKYFVLIEVVDVYKKLSLVDTAISTYEEIIKLSDAGFSRDFYKKELEKLQGIARNLSS